ncbi:MAG TPA: V-type ATP synthase subunit E family protein [Methanolinea sp.]|nr:V-type ATP synthase subunit E family protein [Methanolinea sp.]HQK55953.1 V-type ATP synthase subunit E family protein [Methanolinea sp.]
MAEDVRDLIEKIREEGIRAGEEKAREIEAHARKDAEEILASARLEAERILSEAQERIRREEEREKALLIQAGRDLLLSLRNEICTMLERIILMDVRDSLTPETLFRLLSSIVTQCSADVTGSIEIEMKREDFEIFENSYLSRLKEQTKREIVLRPSDKISGGFIISFDNGRSCFEFSDKSLAEYIGVYLKPKLHAILQEAARE